MTRSITLFLVVCAMGLSAAVTRADDQADVRSSAKAFAEAIQAGDAATAKQHAVSSEASDRFIEAMAGLTKAKKGLLDASVAKFGEDGKTVVNGSPMGGRTASVDQKMDGAKIEVNGDTATVTGESGKPFHFKKEGGTWKADLTSLPNFAQSERAIPMFNGVATAMNQTASEIKDGKYATVQEAQQALRGKIMANFGAGGANRPGRPGPSGGDK